MREVERDSARYVQSRGRTTLRHIQEKYTAFSVSIHLIVGLRQDRQHRQVQTFIFLQALYNLPGRLL